MLAFQERLSGVEEYPWPLDGGGGPPPGAGKPPEGTGRPPEHAKPS
jgi:hypothetical protein